MKSFLQKIVFSFAVVLVATLSVYAQVPQGFNFQAVARGANGDILADQALGVQVSIVKGTEEGNPVYQEAHTVTTNPLGLIQLVIGEGTANEGQVFSELDFGNDNYFVKLAIDPAGGTEYEDLGTTRLLSVPYALVAQRAIEGGVGSGDIPLNINLNTAGEDTALVINIEGESRAEPFQVIAKSTGANRPITARIQEEASNDQGQFAVNGRADGPGTGTHIGVFGSAINVNATTGDRYGLYGQSGSKGKENLGMFGIAFGEGNGDIVLGGNEVEGEGIGSVNAGMVGFATGNLNANIGARGYVYGTSGARVNIGVVGESRTTASGTNIGVEAFSGGSQSENWAFQGTADGSNARNLGMRLNASNGTSNIGLEVNADTAAILNGHSVINGDLTVSGMINGGSSSGGANGQTLDSLFLSTQPEAEFQRNTAFYPGFIRNSDQDGNFVSLSRRALQYGDTETDGTGNVFNWFNKGSMQVTNPDYANGERSAGMSGGYFYMDIFKNENFYVPLQFGIGNAAEGGRSWFQMSSLARQENDKGELYNINISNDPNGTDPNGESSQVLMFGDESPNFQFGGQSWNNNDLAFLNIFGSTPNGSDWYHTNVSISVVSNATEEWGSMNFAKTNIAGQTTQETILLDGENGNINILGTLSQSSDLRLKKDIQTLDNALEKTLEMRGVSYTWKTDITNKNLQIGVIAQEVEKIYPEFIHTDEDGMKSVNYAQMTAVLIEAVKALHLEIQDLKIENTTLQVKIDKQQQLEERLARIEKLIGSDRISKSHSQISEEK